MYFNMSEKETVQMLVLDHDVILGSQYVLVDVEVDEAITEEEE